MGPVYGFSRVPGGRSGFHAARSHTTSCTPISWACSTSQFATASPAVLSATPEDTSRRLRSIARPMPCTLRYAVSPVF